VKLFLAGVILPLVGVLTERNDGGNEKVVGGGIGERSEGGTKKEIADKLLKMALTGAQIVEAAGLWKSDVEKMMREINRNLYKLPFGISCHDEKYKTT
jgi:hypothetical protein